MENLYLVHIVHQRVNQSNDAELDYIHKKLLELNMGSNKLDKKLDGRLKG